MILRPAVPSDADALWAILEPILRAGETYALPRDWDRDTALNFWMGEPHRAFVAQVEGRVLGTYYLQANQRGGGDHVANCGFATHDRAVGRGIARAMAAHAFETARAAGFAAMQFNCVVASNARAVALWHRLGFTEVGRIPHGFRHPRLGPVDALVLHRML